MSDVQLRDVTTLDYTVVLSTLLLSILLYVFAQRRSSQYRGTPHPPGPTGIPVLGNLLQVNVLRPYPQFLAWAREYGPIFRVRMGFTQMVVLNTAEAADELLVNRGTIYSGRASPHVAMDLVSDGQRMVFLGYEHAWRVVRRALQGVIGPGPSRQLRRMQEFESRVLMHDLLLHGDQSVIEEHIQGPSGEVPERHWFAIIRRYTTGVVLNMTYGQRVNRLIGHPYLHRIYNVMGNFTKVSQPGNYMADGFSVLRWLPDFLAPWRIEARKMHVWEMDLWGRLLEECRATFKSGIALAGFVPTYLRARADAGLEDLPGGGVSSTAPAGPSDTSASGWMRDKLLAYTAGSMLEAGSDTTAATIETFIMFMLHNPDALKRAQLEVDEVVPVAQGRLPSWEDEERLPWVIACIKETLRRRPPTIMGVPHRADADDVYEGYFIPKGTTVIGNIWAIHMDASRYPDPLAFRPERWYTPGKPTRWASGPTSQDRDQYAFGWGRRFCQGSYMAEASLFIVLTRLLWGLDISCPPARLPDPNDEETTWTDGFIPVPKIFPAAFRVRSEAHAEVIRNVYADVQREWQVLGLAVDER
ncbi:cytochrome P450 [Rhodofomes roseus]|uniref:Cytochrome P450 n=1 Tax=Rhodofomes roseus TaxID=34475 RepID=A0ABQ8JZA3_9APHY|nr:cytochrome P450 [Rhodofomes roseus]KAH9829079.1 cytochrome P450 [Rhodofomes roseus]